jgi:hypothetical protein
MPVSWDITKMKRSGADLMSIGTGHGRHWRRAFRQRPEIYDRNVPVTAAFSAQNLGWGVPLSSCGVFKTASLALAAELDRRHLGRISVRSLCFKINKAPLLIPLNFFFFYLFIFSDPFYPLLY